MIQGLGCRRITHGQKGRVIPCAVKIRYRHGGTPAVITLADDGMVKVVFDEPVRAATPGQSAVFYDDEERVIGGGVIAKVTYPQ